MHWSKYFSGQLSRTIQVFRSVVKSKHSR